MASRNRNTNGSRTSKYYEIRSSTGQLDNKKSNAQKSGIEVSPRYYLRKAYIAYRRMMRNKKKTAAQKNKRRSNTGFLGGSFVNTRGFIYFCTGFTALLIVILFIWIFTNKNAYEVFVNQQAVGVIAYNKGISAESLYKTAVSKLSSEVDANVSVNEEVSILPKHESKSKINTLDYVIEKIYKSFTYSVEAAGISVEDVEIVIVKSEAEANEILESLQNNYKEEGKNFVESESGFVEKVAVESKFVDPESVSSKDAAYSRLSTNTTAEQTYKVKSGDSIWKIAREYGMTNDELLAINPNVSESTHLKVGQELKVVLPKPLISVKTVEEIKYVTVDKKSEERRENSSQPLGSTKVIQQGKDGQKEVTAHVVRINGFEKEQLIISETPITAAEPVIIEVGTKK